MSQSGLHSPATSFIGRSRELSALAKAIRTARLVTVVGPGGAGKTRLAVETVRRDAVPFCFVDLSTCLDAALFVQSVATVLGLEDRPGTSPLDAAIGALHDETLLLDNCEHLLGETAAFVAEVLRRRSDTTVLATSREPLGLAEEVVFRLPPMQHPDLRELPAPEVIKHYEAVELFIDRARARVPDLAISAEDAVAIARICHRLDGMPLAIELAASRISVLSCEQIAQRLDDRFRLLGTPRGDVATRHRALRDVIDWSYELLDEREQSVLRHLAVFTGGCDIDAAEAICGEDALDVVDRLIEKSLVIVERDAGTARYRLLETVRAFGLEKLAKAGEERTVRRRLAEYYIALADRTYFLQTHEAHLIDVLEAVHDDLTSVITWSLEHDVESAAGLRLAALLWRYWMNRGHLAEGLHLLRRALAETPGGDPLVRARACNGAANLATLRNETADAERLYMEALELRRRHGDLRSVAVSLGDLGILMATLGRYDDARRYSEESLALGREVDNPYQVAVAQSTLGLLDVQAGDYEAAEAEVSAAIAYWRGFDGYEGMATALPVLSVAQARSGRLRLARDSACEALAISRSTGTWMLVAPALEALAFVEVEEGHPQRAAMLVGSSGELRRSLGLAMRPDESRLVEEISDRAAAALGDELFRTTRERGRTLEAGAAVVVALGEGDTPMDAPARGVDAAMMAISDGWVIRFSGSEVRLPASKGAGYLARLIERPHQELHVLDLSADGVAPRAGGAERLDGIEGHAGEILDEESRRAYRRRIEELRAESDEARGWGDAERAARAEEEIEAILVQLAGAFGLGGRARTAADPVERARKAVTNRLREVVARIERADLTLGRHLRNALRTGTFCSYVPDREIAWTVSRAQLPPASR